MYIIESVYYVYRSALKVYMYLYTKSTKVQKYKSTKVQNKYKSTKVQKYKSTKVQKYPSSVHFLSPVGIHFCFFIFSLPFPFLQFTASAETLQHPHRADPVDCSLSLPGTRYTNRQMQNMIRHHSHRPSHKISRCRGKASGCQTV